MARGLCAEGADGALVLTYYVDEKIISCNEITEEGDDFDFRQLVTAETAKVVLAHGLRLEVQILDAKEYFEWLGARQNTYHAQHSIWWWAMCLGAKPWPC